MKQKLAAVVVVMGLVPALLQAQWEGLIEWSRLTELATATSGVVAQVQVQAGDTVKSGQTLLQLEQRAFKARLEQALAEVRYQRMQREEANKELERATELYERTLLADHELDLAKIAAAQAEAGFRAAQAVEQAARQELAYSELRAPFDARVIARHVEPGQTVVNRLQAAPMLVLAEQQHMQARVVLDATAATGLMNGQHVAIEVNGQRYEGDITAIQYRPDTAKPYEVVIRFQTDGSLLAGLPAKVSRR